jgi:hypothetical protein
LRRRVLPAASSPSAAPCNTCSTARISNPRLEMLHTLELLRPCTRFVSHLTLQHHILLAASRTQSDCLCPLVPCALLPPYL